MRAQEVQLERVVRRLAWACVGHRLDLDKLLAVPSGGIGPGGVEELAPGDGDQPALGIPRRVVRPYSQRLDQCVLHGILRRREVGAASDKNTNHGGGEGPHQG